MSLSGCASQIKWYDWNTTACGPDANWTTLWSYYIDGITYTDYWLSSRIYDMHWNTAVAIRVLYDKINAIEAGLTVNMDSILNAMLAANFKQLEKFIGIEEAYRLALWNAPFNADMFAALGRGFAKWPEP